MPRPKCCRHIGDMPDKTCFRPEGGGAPSGGEVLLTLDEYEAIRLADLDGLYQEQAAARMNVSRQTFGRIIAEAHRKLADVLVHGKSLRIQGGSVVVEGAESVRSPHRHRALETTREKRSEMSALPKPCGG
ncbi:MAG: DUF134 domain-containing protein [Proteobacteria bacterium]|nr:DUF134 domain-containing protein [Pseudomonadota bacterium]